MEKATSIKMAETPETPEETVIHWSRGNKHSLEPSSASNNTAEVTAAQELAKKGKRGLLELLKLNSEDDWREWLVSDLVKPYWLELWDYLAKNPTAKQKRGAGLARIQELIIKGEARGVAKYSRRHVEKTGWDLNEHLAYFVHNVRSENTHRRGGVFFQKNLPENIMDTAIWTLKNILIQMHSPSQINKPSGGKAIFGETLPEYKSIKVHNTRAQQAAKAGADSAAKSKADPKEVQEPESDGESSLSSLADTTEDEFPGPLGAQQPRTQVWEHEPLSDRQRLILKRQSETFDLKDPFWAYARIEAALQLSGPQTIAQAEEMVATAESAESVETDDVSDTTPRKPKRVKKAVDMRKMLDNRVFESSAYQTAENLQWSFDTSTDANDLLIQPTLEDYERISMHEKWLDAQEYQFDNHEEACRNLGIVDKANPRIKGMQRGQELKFWQP
ncbi:hypothetical protein BO70DRAFT_431326, partial [Aspergillus heteromorphus CBS 117.55]